MWFQNRSYLSSVGLHILLFIGLWIFTYRASLFTETPVEITEIISRTAATNSVPTHRPKPLPEHEPKPRLPEATAPGSAPSQNTQSTTSTTQSDSSNTGPVAEEYEVGEMPILLNEVRVPYPPEAKSKGIQGNVIFDLVVNREGKITEAKVVSSPDSSLTQAATQAVMGFRFRPARMADKPVAIKIRYSYRFILE